MRIGFSVQGMAGAFFYDPLEETQFTCQLNLDRTL